MPDGSRQIRQYGLTQVYKSDEEPLVDIVFVHGLNGHPKNTWTSHSSDVFWPADLLPDILARRRVRILTYGYNANVTAFTDGASKDHLHNHAETLAAQLAANRNLRDCLERPIIFVCHSLGGLVVKRALLYCRSVTNEKLETLRSIYVSTYGILFLGTPHNGSDLAKWGHLLQNICSVMLPKKFMDSSPQLIKTLKANNELLQNINLLFVDIVPRFHIYFFHETKPMDLKGSRELIVDETSAAPILEGVERMGIEADHSHMCKFDDENSPGFEGVAEALFRYSRDAPATIAGRWMEEKQTRMLEKKAKAHEIFHAPMDSSMEGSMSENMGLMGGSIASLPCPDADGKTSPTSQLARSTELREPLFVAPAGFHPNAAFFGMEKELNELHTRLFKAKKRAERLVAVLICGGPGSGKSHLARQYVYTRRTNYPGGIFWVDAKSRQSTFKCYSEIAEAASLANGKDFPTSEWRAPGKNHVDAVRKWFESREEWLLVFDGLSFDKDEEITSFKQFLPFRKNCSIIYTSKDQTLRKKQRLFEPYCLTVRPLGVEDACKLLFKDLGIKKPTTKQKQKAIELVKHYQCLPLAIHAIGHRLSATAKPIERYHINSHLTDGRLAEPFLGIMLDLYREEHFEALNLINLLSFFGHRVPVGLINLGKDALETWKVEVMSSSRPGDRDIDTTLGILIRYGLIERVYYPYGSSQKGASSQEDGEETVDGKMATPEPSEGGGPDTPFSVYQSSVDVIKIHSVVQGFCRDELKIMDREQRAAKPRGQGVVFEGGLQDAGFHDSWLVVAVGVFCKSYETAHGKMRASKDSGMIKDYREYETHAEKLVEHFPKALDKAPYVVRDARQILREAIESIRHEIEKMSPNSSQESFRHHKSVFDRSSSSSSVPESSADEGLSGQTTWYEAPGSARVESPRQILPQKVNLGLFPPHIFRESSGKNDDGYETDGEREATLRGSPALSQVTERPPAASSEPHPLEEEDGWEIVRGKLHTPPPSSSDHRRRHRGRGSRNLGEYRPMHPLTRLSSFQATGSPSRAQDSAGHHRPSNSGSEAETLLAAVHHSSPPPSRGGGIKAVGRSTPQKENSQTYATVVARNPRAATVPSRRSSPSPRRSMPPWTLGPEARSSRDSLRSRSSNVQSSPHSESRVDKLTRLNHSEPALGFPMQKSMCLDPNSAPASRFHSRQPSAVNPDDLPKEVFSSPPAEPGLPPLAPPPYERDIEITHSHRLSLASRPSNVATTGHSLGPVAHPSAFFPGTSPPPAPDGYTSVPMSRDASLQSQHSLQTEPSRFPPRFSPMPSVEPPTIQMTPPNGFAKPIPHQQQQMVSGAGDWAVPFFNENTALHHPDVPTTTSYVARDMSRPASLVADHQLTRFQCGGEPELLLGEHVINVGDARQRVRDWENARLLQAAATAPRHVPNVQYVPVTSLADPPMVLAPGIGLGQQGALQTQDPNRRARSGSSPPRPGSVGGFGLRL